MSWGDGLSLTDPLMLLLERLPTCVNKNSIDQVAIEFCEMNNKGNRKRLAEALFKVRRSRLDLLPLYSRLVATLNPGIPELADEVVGHLQGEFRFFVRKKIQDGLEIKIKNVRFLAEMTKFKMAKPNVILSFLTVLIRTFKGDDIDLVCSILETCGRFLYRTGTTHVRTKKLLEIMKKKRSALVLNERYNALIDNAVYYCDPPQHRQTQRKVRPIVHEYFRHMLYHSKDTSGAQRTMRKFPWDDEEFYAYGVKCFVRCWKVNFTMVQHFARMLYELSTTRDTLAIMVCDAVLEEIRIGMETNILVHTQRRLCTIKYLSELYRFKLVDGKVIFNVLYALLSSAPSMDHPDNYFRCKLVCTLLDGCGAYFLRGGGRGKRQLQDFLVYFQRYAFFTKPQPLPSDTEITISDTFELLGGTVFQMYDTIEEVDAEIYRIEEEAQRLKVAADAKIAARTKPVASTAGVATASVGVGVSSEQADEADGDDDGDASDSGSGSEDGDGDDDDESGSEDGDDEEAAEEDDNVVFLAGDGSDEEIESDADDDKFVEEFNKMMAGEIEARRNDASASSIQKLDVAIPLHLRGSKPMQVEEDDGTGAEQRVVFTLLNRNQTTKELVVPVASGLADRMMARQEREAEERQRNAQFVMNYQEREMEQEEAQRLADDPLPIKQGRRTVTRLFSTSGTRGRGGGRGGSGAGFSRGGFTGGGGGRGYTGGTGYTGGMRAGGTAPPPKKGDQDFLREMGYAKKGPKGEYRGQPIPSEL
jgi:regulator of nonsense transcripts 2